MSTIRIQRPTIITSRIFIGLVFTEWINIIVNEICKILKIEDEKDIFNIKNKIKQNYTIKNEIYKQFKKFLINK
jgi:hypothetical protein